MADDRRKKQMQHNRRYYQLPSQAWGSIDDDSIDEAINKVLAEMAKEGILFKDDVQKKQFLDRQKQVLDKIIGQLRYYEQESCPLWDELAKDAGVKPKYSARYCVRASIRWLQSITNNIYDEIIEAGEAPSNVVEMPRGREQYQRAATKKVANVWVITRDLVKLDEERGDVGRGVFPNGFTMEKAKALPVRFKLYDDDGELMYEGRASDDEAAFEAKDWGEGWAGVTEVKTSTGREPFVSL